jgi:hypothetical protein
MLGAARPLSLAGTAEPVGCSGGRIPDFLTLCLLMREKERRTKMFRRFHVKKDERALLFWKGDFVDPAPG